MPAVAGVAGAKGADAARAARVPEKSARRDATVRIALGRLREDPPATGQLTAPNGAAYDHRFIASTELLAKDGGIIKLDAWRQGLPAYMKRPLWIARHDLYCYEQNLDETALGSVVYIAIEGGLPVDQVGPSGQALVAYVRYSSLPFAQNVKTLYDEGALTDVSVRWDWQTEVLRAPYEEEVLQFGDGLYWVAERADLMELSSILRGADDGAQRLRADVEAAMVRCREAGRPLVALEEYAERMAKAGDAPQLPAEVELDGWRAIARGELPERMTSEQFAFAQTMTQESARSVDPAAMGDALTTLDNALMGFDAWMDAGQAVRQALADGMAAAKNLLVADADDAAGAESEAGGGDPANPSDKETAADTEPRAENQPAGAAAGTEGLAELVAQRLAAIETGLAEVRALIDATTPAAPAPVPEPVAAGDTRAADAEREADDDEDDDVIEFDVEALKREIAARKAAR